MKIHPFLAAVPLLFLASCENAGPKTAVLWTDRPEFAIYAEYFNAAQARYKVEVRYHTAPAADLAAARDYPDIVAGSWLKSAATRTLFKPLDYLLQDGALEAEAFYPRLLALGRIEDRQYLFPVSFNLPALVFSRSTSPQLSNLFVIGLEEIKTLGKAYNTETRGSYSRMGFCFSPSWNDEFLFVAATLFDTSFQEGEGTPAAWDAPALERTVGYIRDWITEANTGIAAEDDFAFKYFYEPPQKLVLSGRILFTCMESSEFFTLPQEQRAGLDFRWIAGEERIPLAEETVYYGICKNGKAPKAADAFTEWFFQTDTLFQLLDAGRRYRFNETVFGIAGGLSALHTVTEQVFPQFYPGLLGHIPPEGFLYPPNILPRNWPAIKERVILPYLHKRIRAAEEGGDGPLPLEQQIAEWVHLNRNVQGVVNR